MNKETLIIQTLTRKLSLRSYLIKRERRVGYPTNWNDLINIQNKRLKLERFKGYESDRYTLTVRKLLYDLKNHTLKWQNRELEIYHQLVDFQGYKEEKTFNSLEKKAFHSLTLTISQYRNNYQIENVLWSKLNRNNY